MKFIKEYFVVLLLMLLLTLSLGVLCGLFTRMVINDRESAELLQIQDNIIREQQYGPIVDPQCNRAPKIIHY